MFLLSVRELLRLATAASRRGLQVQGRHIVMCNLRRMQQVAPPGGCSLAARCAFQQPYWDILGGAPSVLILWLILVSAAGSEAAASGLEACSAKSCRWQMLVCMASAGLGSTLCDTTCNSQSMLKARHYESDFRLSLTVCKSA